MTQQTESNEQMEQSPIDIAVELALRVCSARSSASSMRASQPLHQIQPATSRRRSRSLELERP